MNALVLSGGGSRAVFEWHVCRLLMAAGMRWDVIAGVSAGALVGSLVAGVQIREIEAVFVDQLMDRIRKKDLLSGGMGIRRALQLVGVGGRRYSVYDTDPMKKLLEEWIRPEWFDRPFGPHFIAGVTLLQDRYYWAARLGSIAPEERLPVIRASASIPVLFEPVKRGLPGTSWGVDGGVRNMSPLGDVLDFGPAHIALVNASNPFARRQPMDEDPSSFVDVLQETISQMNHEIFEADIKVFLDRNEEAKEYEREVGRPHPRWKVFRHAIVQPVSEEWPDSLDFTAAAKRRMMTEAHREVERSLRVGDWPL